MRQNLSLTDFDENFDAFAPALIFKAKRADRHDAPQISNVI